MLADSNPYASSSLPLHMHYPCTVAILPDLATVVPLFHGQNIFVVAGFDKNKIIQNSSLTDNNLINLAGINAIM